MFKRFRYMIILVILLISALRVEAQQDMPDYVAVGSQKHYHVKPNPIPGSTYIWKIGVDIQTSTTNEIYITWDTPGTFTLSVQEKTANECLGPIQSGEVYVYELTLGVSGTNVSCPGGNDGTATVSVTGGTAPYRYLWSDGQTTDIAVNLTAGTYTVKVTDDKGFSRVISYEVKTNPDITPPTFTKPEALIDCVENLHTASFDMATNGLVTSWADYYLFTKGNQALDLDVSKFADNCPLTCPVEIRWRIEMNDGTTIPALPAQYQTGQPSAYSSDIQFAGDGTNFTNVVHTITYWIKDCNGNISDPQTQTITIKPRPNILVAK